MKRTIKAEMKQSMDALHFSQEEKNAMVYDLLANARQEQKTGFGRRKLILVALAAVMLMATLTGAAVFTRWSTTAQAQYNPSQEIKEQAEKSGLSVMLEETKGAENPNEVLSVTDQGITITAVQTIVDNYNAEITFRIEGLELPEDEEPSAWPTVTIDGDLFFYGSQEGGFFNGTTHNEDGEWVYASTGEPVKSRDDEFQSAILDYVADDGSLEYTHHISFNKTDGSYFGKEIVFTFNSIDIQHPTQKAGPSIPQVEGNWELKWILTGTSDNICIEPNAEIGNSGVILLEAEIGQKTIRTRYQVKELWDGWDELVEFPFAISGVRMKDGREHLCFPSTSGFENQEDLIYFIESDMFDTILDVSKVDALIFCNGRQEDASEEPIIPTFYYIPIA